MKLGFLRPLYEQIGDYVSVYTDTGRAHENAAEQIELRWRAARERLAAAGAGAALLDAVGEALTDPAGAAAGRAVFGRDGAVVFAAALDAPPRREIARLAPLPHAMPLLAERAPRVPHVRVSATRAGGELVTVGGDGQGWRDSVAGRAWPVHKTRVGGWAQDHYQHGVENAWDENAKALAAEVASAAARVGAGRVVVAGDARARSLLLHHLPAPLATAAAVVEEEVSADSPAMAVAANRALADWAERGTRERFDDWRAKRERGLTVQGLAQTMAALREGQVSDLFLADDPSSDATAWIGPGGGELAASRDELREWGVAQPVSDRADAALVRAIASTDAELHFLPGDLVETGDPAALGQMFNPRDGVCATLRFSVRGG